MTDARGILSVALNRREVIVPTEAEDFRYIRHNYRGAYVIIRPSQDSDTWKAIATWGNSDELIADSSDELLGLIRRHYGPKTEGYTEMLTVRIERKCS